jgi:hypothetical protein
MLAADVARSSGAIGAEHDAEWFARALLARNDPALESRQLLQAIAPVERAL